MIQVIRVSGWEPYELLDLGHISWVGSVPTDPVQHIITAGQDLDDRDDLSVDSISVEGLSVDGLSVDDVFVDDVSGDAVSGDDLSGDDVSGDELSVDDLSVDNLSGDDIYLDDLSVDNLSVDYLSVDDMSGRVKVSRVTRAVSACMRYIRGLHGNISQGNQNPGWTQNQVLVRVSSPPPYFRAVFGSGYHVPPECAYDMAILCLS